MSGPKPLERTEIGPMTADAGHYRAEPAQPEPSSFRRVNPPLSPANAGASRRKPTPARPCTVAGDEPPDGTFRLLSGSWAVPV